MLSAIARVLAAARAVLAVPIGYLTVLTGAAWVATALRSRRTAATGGGSRVAVVVPAHDEEEVIAETLEALAALDGPDRHVVVHVVADHCTDATADIARGAGVDVLEHRGTERGKGAALQWAIAGLLDADEPPDVVVIIDADTLVRPELLTAIEARLAGGARVVQAQYRVRDPGSSPGAGLRAAALALRHHLRPLGRTAIGASSGLYGNGMAFRADVLRGRPWTSHLTEDIELQMALLFDGILVDYAPDAVVEAAMPATLEGARTQNERWERGRLELARRYVPPLARAAIAPGRSKVPRLAAADAALDHLVPPLSVLVAATGGVAVASSVVGALRRTGVTRGWGLVGLLGFHVVSGLVLGGAPASVYRSLVHAPGMVVWKVGLWGRMLGRRGEMEWVRTSRGAST